MNWYIAKVIFKISNGNSGAKSQFDEHLRLIQAWSFEEALLKARVLGLTEEDHFINSNDQTVDWEFVNVSELLPLHEITDGLELYSRVHETEEAHDYVRYVHQKAASLQVEQTLAV